MQRKRNGNKNLEHSLADSLISYKWHTKDTQPGQPLLAEQFLVVYFLVFPLQFLPPFRGFGLVQLLVFVKRLVPVPHVTEHALADCQGFQEDHPPLT